MDGLGSGDPAEGQKILEAIEKDVPEVRAKDVVFKEVLVQRSDVSPAGAGNRIPDRSLLTGADDKALALSDEQMEKGELKVSATVGGDKWFVALDMGPEDVVFTGA